MPSTRTVWLLLPRVGMNTTLKEVVLAIATMSALGDTWRLIVALFTCCLGIVFVIFVRCLHVVDLCRDIDYVIVHEPNSKDLSKYVGRIVVWSGMQRHICPSSKAKDLKLLSVYEHS